MDKTIFEPLKQYNGQFKEQHNNNVIDYYDKLTQQSHVDIEVNHVTCKKYYDKEAKIAKLTKSRNRKKVLRGFLIAWTIIGLAVGTTLLILFAASGNAVAIIVSIALIVTGIGALLLDLLVVKKQIKQANSIINALKQEALALQNEAYAQMAPLNALFDWGIPAKLFSTTCPLIEMDQCFTMERFQHLNEKYGFEENNDDFCSCEYAQSGLIQNNPFLIERNYVQDMINVTYTGTLVISYPVTIKTKDGTTTVTRTQTLVAHVVKPKPHYFYDTWLVMANDAAPRLSFSRQPSKANEMNEKQMQRHVHDFEKDLQKKQKKDITKNFTALSNTEFEAFFNALNRDEEMEFRLLFTPLAQKSLMDLIKNKQPFGDDFIYEKRKTLNYVKCRHFENSNVDGNPEQFKNFDYDKSREYFISFNNNYFRDVYFNFAPLLAIPIFQQTPQHPYECKSAPKKNVTSFEVEAMANRYPQSSFVSEEFDTDAILKAEFVQKQGDSDLVNIHAYGFHSEPRVEIVPTMGGDGKLHPVPVTWYEYLPVEKVTPMVVQGLKAEKEVVKNNYDKIIESLSKYAPKDAIISSRGFISFLAAEGLSSAYNGKELNDIFSHKEE